MAITLAQLESVTRAGSAADQCAALYQLIERERAAKATPRTVAGRLPAVGSKRHEKCIHHEPVPAGSTLTTKVLCWGQRKLDRDMPEQRIRFVAAIDKAVLAKRKAWVKRPAPVVTARARKATPHAIPRSTLHVHGRGCWVWLLSDDERTRLTGWIPAVSLGYLLANKRAAAGAGYQVCRTTGAPHPDEARRARRRKAEAAKALTAEAVA